MYPTLTESNSSLIHHYKDKKIKPFAVRTEHFTLLYNDFKAHKILPFNPSLDNFNTTGVP